MDEGCLSVRGPSLRRDHARREAARPGPGPRFSARSSSTRRGSWRGIMQHETDHLEGMLFIDRLDDEGRRDVMRQLREQEV